LLRSTTIDRARLDRRAAAAAPQDNDQQQHRTNGQCQQFNFQLDKCETFSSATSANAQGFANQLDRHQSRQNRQNQTEIGHVDSDSRQRFDVDFHDVGNFVNSGDGSIVIDSSINNRIDGNDNSDSTIDNN
jgi:hypothetical protein